MNAMDTARLDVREISPKDRHARIFEFVDSLPPGAGFTLVNDHYPKPLLYLFQAERPGQFDWSVLEDGPEVWRVFISRVDPETSGPEGRKVSDYLSWDHDRLDTALTRSRDFLVRGERDAALSAFREFSTGLLRHIRMEEEVLFPAFETATGMGSDGPIRVMKDEHREIEKIISAMDGWLAGPDAGAGPFDTLRGQLGAVLGGHNEKEEQIVYPMTDEALAPADREALIRRMQAS
jgi:uncharacterized protein (DUF2249 family)/hemerythrin-like domain-containing protein